MLLTLALQAADTSTDDRILERVLSGDTLEMLIVFGTGALIAITAIVGGLIRSVAVGRARERTRQEVAAYVAEGSMTADEGERLLQAGETRSGR